MLKIAVLPLNAAEGVPPQIGRQIPAFIADQLRVNDEVDIQSVSFLSQVEQDGVARAAFVNFSDGMLETGQLKDLFDQSEADISYDGMVEAAGEGYKITTRMTMKGDPENGVSTTTEIQGDDIFAFLHREIKKLATAAQIPLPETLSGEKMEFGTAKGDVFLNFIIGYDAVTYIQQANGMVAQEFNPETAMNSLLEANEKDADFEGPYHVLVGLCRACTNYQIGSFELVEQTLVKLTKSNAENFGAFFALGELYQAAQQWPKAVDYFEKASILEPEDAGILNRLGNAQASMNMYVNSERNFRKALELEGPDKPSADFLAGVLQATGRDHEIPNIWRDLVKEFPENPELHAKYAISLIQNEKQKEGEEVFEKAITELEDNTLIKRYYAPYLAQNEDLDRAMDFYEDCIDVAPNDVQLLLEYANTLKAADREFEVPEVLQTVLKANPDANTRANTLAWLIEIEQPKRVETVTSAEEKLAAGDAAGAIRELKPLRNWLADYWKLWAMLASAHNRVGEYKESEEAATKLLELFPGCEPGFGELREALNGQERHEDAWNLMQFAFSQNQQSFGLFVNLGLAARRAGKTEEAKQIAEQIRAVVQQNPDMESQIRDILAEIEQ